jgi:hypothetical protein
MYNDGTEPVYPDRQILREVVTILVVPELPEETDQEIELLLQSTQRDWSGLSQLEPIAQASKPRMCLVRCQHLRAIQNRLSPSPSLSPSTNRRPREASRKQSRCREAGSQYQPKQRHQIDDQTMLQDVRRAAVSSVSRTS